MKVKVEFYKYNGKFYCEENFEIIGVDVWETDKITDYIDLNYPTLSHYDYIFTAKHENMSNQRLIKKT